MEQYLDERTRPLLDYIRQHRQSGYSDEIIHNTLLQHNWDPLSINHAFSLLQPEAQEAAAAPPKGPHLPHQNDHPAEQDSGPVPADVHHAAHEKPAEPGDHRRKYRLYRAIADTIIAVRNNLVATMAGWLLTLIVFAAVLVLGSIIIGALTSLIPESYGTMTSFILTMLMTFIVISLASACMMTSLSLAVSDGAGGHRSSLGDLVQRSLKLTVRVMAANALFYFTAVAGYLAALVFTFVSIVLFRDSALASMASVFMIFGASIWSLFAIFRYFLVPYVAVFEPELPIRGTLKRSFHLVRDGGQWFFAKGMLLLFIILITLSSASGQTLEQLSASGSITLTLILAVLNSLAIGIGAMLYQNRRRVRG